MLGFFSILIPDCDLISPGAGSLNIHPGNHLIEVLPFGVYGLVAFVKRYYVILAGWRL
jgi:hypothetical protein